MDTDSTVHLEAYIGMEKYASASLYVFGEIAEENPTPKVEFQSPALIQGLKVPRPEWMATQS